MDQATQIALARRVLGHLEARTTDRAPAPSTRAVSAYRGAERLARERDALFRRLPQCVAHGSQLPEPGDFLAREVAGRPLLLVRGDDGRARAFLDVCRHRGSRLTAAPCGKAKSFVCPYHAWTYGRDGALLGLPHRDGFPGVSADTHSLRALPTAERAGFVWVTPTPDGSVDLEGHAGALLDELAGLGTTSAFAYDVRDAERPLDWKLVFDIFLEAYHLKKAHAGSIYPMFFDNVGLVDSFPPHLRTVFPKRTIRQMAEAPPEQWCLREHANILYVLFPSTLVLVEPDHAAVIHIDPVAEGRTRLRTYALVPEEPRSDKARRYWDANNRVLFAATDEDFALGESIQAGLASGANEELTFGTFEHALAHFHRAVDEGLGGA